MDTGEWDIRVRGLGGEVRGLVSDGGTRWEMRDSKVLEAGVAFAWV